VLRAACKSICSCFNPIKLYSQRNSFTFLNFTVTAYGNLGDASSALWLFSKFSPQSTRTWNVLVGTLAKVAETGALFAVEPMSSSASKVFDDISEILALNTELHSLQQKSSLFEVVRLILNAMSERGQIDDICAPIADSQCRGLRLTTRSDECHFVN
jgi:hypothetical protein